jgi:hypothetical protein
MNGAVRHIGGKILTPAEIPRGAGSIQTAPAATLWGDMNPQKWTRREFHRAGVRIALPLMAASSLRMSGQSKAPFEAAAARRDITPATLLPISGGMGEPTQAKSRQGDLTARAMVFRAGAETVALAGLDLLGYPAVLGDRARALVPRLKPENILIGVTHTHSAPDCYAFPDGKGGHTGSLEYMDFVARQTAAAINEALDRLEPADLRIAAGDAKGKIAYNYYAPDLYDRTLNVLQIRARGGRTLGTLVNYAIHPEVMGSGQGIMSPDLVGPLYDRIEQAGGGVTLFMNSAQGGMVTADNRNLDEPKDKLRAYWNDSRSWSECERIGRLLADESLRVIAPAAWQAEPALTNRWKEVRFPVDSDIMWQVVSLSPLKYRRGDDHSITVRVNLVSLGTAQMLTIPGEALPNIGLYLRRKMPAQHKFLLGLTNDAFGYILTKVDFDSFPAYRYISRTSLGEMTGEIYIQNALELMQVTGR